MNRYKINCIVEYIRMQDEMEERFPFDVTAVWENVEEILAYFGFFSQLTDEEREVLKADLSKIAEASECDESAYLVEYEVGA